MNDIIDKKKLLNNFKDVRTSSNIDLILCTKILFSKNGFIYNIGSYILSFIILFFIMATILFYLKENTKLMNKIKAIENENDIKISKIRKEENNADGTPTKSINKENNKFENIVKRKVKIIKLKNNENSSSLLTNSNNNINLINNNNISINENTLNNINNFVDYEINSFSYEEASKYDKRTYFQ